jgi:hypothetical protein
MTRWIQLIDQLHGLTNKRSLRSEIIFSSSIQQPTRSYVLAVLEIMEGKYEFQRFRMNTAHIIYLFVTCLPLRVAADDFLTAKTISNVQVSFCFVLVFSEKKVAVICQYTNLHITSRVMQFQSKGTRYETKAQSIKH